FAPLASNLMLAVYSNGAAPQPYLTNLRFQKSGGGGTWTTVAASGGGNGAVFSTDSTIDANDWTLVAVGTETVHAFRRDSSGPGMAGPPYPPAWTVWKAMPPPPPPFASGQLPKGGAGLFGASDGTNLWLFPINSDPANSILFSAFTGAAWTPWATVPGTD